MRHYSCDLCGKDLTAGADARYVVHVRVAPAPDVGELTEADLDGDHVAAMAAFLEELEEGGEAEAGPATATATMEYDLCPGCRRKFVADPLGRAGRALRFSKN
jgi:hypothetical protein